MRDAAVPFEGFPFIIGWEFTVACNLRCRHCGSSAGTPRTSELTTKEALALCDQFPELCVREVDFTGGEPLLRPDWPIVAARVVELGIAANILTNGLLIKPSILSQMKDIGIGGVGISLDGLEATHDSIRARPGSFAAVLAAIDAMQRAEMPFNVITTVNALNLPELPRMLDLLASLGVGFWRLQALIPMGRVVGQRDLPLDPPSVARLGFFIQRHAASAASRGLRIICSDGLEYTGVDGMDAGPWQGCSAGIVSCGITSDGKVKGCLSMPDELAEGDLRSSDLWGIWFHPDSFAYTRKFQASELGPHCSGCEKAEECRGGCSSSSFCSTGRFHNDSSCFHKAASSEAETLDPGQTRTQPHARSSA